MFTGAWFENTCALFLQKLNKEQYKQQKTRKILKGIISKFESTRYELTE